MFRDLSLICQTLRLRSRLRTRLRWSADQLAEHQLRCVQRLVHHAYCYTRLYRKLYDAAGIHPQDVRSLEDFACLPTVNKAMLRAAFPDEVIASTHSPKDLKYGLTGGSTGEPLRFALDRAAVAHKVAGNLRSMEMAGYRAYRDRLVQTSPDAGMFGDWTKRLGNLCLKRYCLDPFHRDWEQAVRRLRRVRPDVLVGWTSYLRELADRLLDHGQRLPVRLVLTTSEDLLIEDRRRMEQAFESPVLDQYGSTEFGRVATEIPGASGLVIHADITLVESLAADSQDDHLGELVLTSLVNRGMPLIRYRIGDRGRISERTSAVYPAFPVLERLGGRVQDMLTRIDGSRVPPEFVHRTLRTLEPVEQYQVVQQAAGDVEIRLRLKSPLPAQTCYELKQQFVQQLGNRPIRVSTQVPFESDSGKRRLVINRMPHAAV